MTYEEFTNKVRKTNLFEKYCKYFVSIAIIGVGLFFLYLLNFTEWYDIKKVATKNTMPISGIYVLCGLFILLGLYGFWRIPQTYEMTFITSDFSIDKKSQIINQIISDFSMKELERDEQYGHFRYVGRFWNPFDIYIFYDKNYFYLNCQQIDYDGGYIDFGTSKRVTNKIKNKIIALL